MAASVPSAHIISALQRRLVADWHATPPEAPEADPFLQLVAENHRRNFTLWHHEDDARRDDMGPDFVFAAKRAIDAANQQRNDFIEKMDQALHAALSPRFAADVHMHTETPGMIIDRLSILSLKEYHMAEQSERKNADAEHRSRCQAKLEIIRRQISDLRSGLDELLQDCAAGRRGFRIYFQFKMYNDPTLNPALYAQR